MEEYVQEMNHIHVQHLTVTIPPNVLYCCQLVIRFWKVYNMFERNAALRLP